MMKVVIPLLIILIMAGCGLSKNAIAPNNGDCPVDHPIKGHVDEATGVKIFHFPGDQYYRRTNAKECFANAADAVNAGYRPIRRR